MIIKMEKENTTVGKLNPGAVFMSDGEVFIKTDFSQLNAVNLKNGEAHSFSAETRVEEKCAELSLFNIE